MTNYEIVVGFITLGSLLFGGLVALHDWFFPAHYEDQEPYGDASTYERETK